MQAVDFRGSERLVERIDRSLQAESTDQVVHSVKDSLVQMMELGEIDLPRTVQVPGETSYGRHLLYRSDEHDYVVVAMAWGPGQGTPVHDHAGEWCVECVWKGEFEIVQYHLLETEADRCRFENQGAIRAARGSAGALIPPYEYHTIANANPLDTSVTIHIYGRELEQCAVFQPLDDGWYQREVKSLAYMN